MPGGGAATGPRSEIRTRSASWLTHQLRARHRVVLKGVTITGPRHRSVEIHRSRPFLLRRASSGARRASTAALAGVTCRRRGRTRPSAGRDRAASSSIPRATGGLRQSPHGRGDRAGLSDVDGNLVVAQLLDELANRRNAYAFRPLGGRSGHELGRVARQHEGAVLTRLDPTRSRQCGGGVMLSSRHRGRP
jgi:hypothetical protein